MQSIYVAVPVYNNPDTLRAVVEGCMREMPGRVIVVDDGSARPASELLEGLEVTLIKHERNMGKGAAILTASRHIESIGGTHMITIDADGQHSAAELPKFTDAIAASPDALMVGARDFATENVPGSSRFGRRFANFWLRVESGARCSDCQSGYRAYPVAHLNRLKLRGLRYDFEAEVLARASWAGLPIIDIPIAVHYPPREERVSHFKPIKDNFWLTHRHILLILRRLVPLPQKRLVKTERMDWSLLKHPRKMLQLLLSEHATPGGLAAAAAVGVFLGAVPFLFMHTLVILYVATRLNLNKLVALNTQHICMPPLVPALCIEIGYYIRNGRWLTDLSYETIFVQFGYRLYEWFIGSLIIGPILAAIVGAIFYYVARAMQRRGDAHA